MKVSRTLSEPFSAIRKRALAQAGAQAVHGNLAVDRSQFLGLSETDMTPAVQGAIRTLLTEVDDLRGEVSRLKQRLEETEFLADRDALTPVFNRRALVRELHKTASFVKRYGSPASLVYFDLDGFKSVNDRWGHAAGDAALTAVAQRLSGLVRDSDVVGRMGGDEFAVILVQSDQATAEAKAEALVRGIEAEPMRFGDWSAPLHLTFGVSQIDPEKDPESTIAAADAAMYAKKRLKAAG